MEKINIKDNLHWIIPSTITALGFVIGTFWVGIMFLIISFIYIIYHFFGGQIGELYKKYLELKVNKFGKVKILLLFLVLLLFSVFFIFIFFLNSNPKIYDLTKGFNLKFEDNFEGGNFKNDNNYNWIIKDNQLANSIGNGITLKTSSLKERGYPIYQNLKNLKGDRLLLSKFYLPEGGRISLQFANTKNYESNEILDLHYQECRISSFEGKINNINYSKGYGDYLYKRGSIDGPYNKENIISGNYYMLAIISNSKLSCYFQREGEKDYHQIIIDKTLEFENLGGPAITRFIDSKENFPKILDFKLFTKN